MLKCEEQELWWVDSKEIGEKEKSKRLLQLFQCDLLPGLSADIFSAKSARDSVPTRGSISIGSKIVFYAIIVVVNALMLFYILLFAIQQTKHRQRAWFQTFMLWFMTEVLLTCTMVVWVMHYLIPAFIVDDIRKLEGKVMSILSNSLTSGSQRQGQIDGSSRVHDDREFNAAEYLFVSQRIAKRLPNNPVAKLVMSFQTPWPKQSYKMMKNGFDSSAYRSGISYGLGNFLGMLAYGLGRFLQLPRGLQDCLVHVVSSVATGYVVLGHEQLFILYPALAFLPLFFFCLFVHLQLARRRRKVKSHPVLIIAEEKSSREAQKDSSSSPTPTGLRQNPALDRRASLIRGVAMIEDARQQLEAGHGSRDDHDSLSSGYDSPYDNDDDPSINSSASCFSFKSKSSHVLDVDSIDYSISQDDAQHSDHPSVQNFAGIHIS